MLPQEAPETFQEVDTDATGRAYLDPQATDQRQSKATPRSSPGGVIDHGSPRCRNEGGAEEYMLRANSGRTAQGTSRVKMQSMHSKIRPARDIANPINCMRQAPMTGASHESVVFVRHLVDAACSIHRQVMHSSATPSRRLCEIWVARALRLELAARHEFPMVIILCCH